MHILVGRQPALFLMSSWGQLYKVRTAPYLVKAFPIIKHKLEVPFFKLLVWLGLKSSQN